MKVVEKIRSSLSIRLSLWVAGFVIVISVVVILLTSRYSEQIINGELTDTTQEALENTALKIRHAIRQAEITAQLEHRTFQPDKAYIEMLLEEYKPQQFLTIQVTDQEEKAGERSVTQLTHDDETCYKFYEPVYGHQYGLVVIIPAKSLYGYFYHLQLDLILTGVVGILLLLAICWIVINRRLYPLRLLAASAQRIAGGHLDESIPRSSRVDEIGRLQNSFGKMQRSLNNYLMVIRRKQSKLSQQNVKLREAYAEIQEYDKLKRLFISEMTHKMSAPVKTVCEDTKTICADYSTLTKGDMARIQLDILAATGEVTQLLDKLLNAPQQPNAYDVPTDNQHP